MHSYDNGTAIRVKKDNWGQLMKFFRKQGLEIITDAEVTSIIHCEDGAVAGFIKRIYQALTQREVQEVVQRVSEGGGEERSDQAFADIAPSQRGAARSKATVLHEQLLFCDETLLVTVAPRKLSRLIALLRTHCAFSARSHASVRRLLLPAANITALRLIYNYYHCSNVVHTRSVLLCSFLQPQVERPPPYMRHTGSKKIKDTLRTGNFTEHPDETTTAAALRGELELHEAGLQHEKSIDPERFSSSLSLSGSKAPHVSKVMGEVEAPVPQVTVERIEVKQSDKSIAHLRASRDPMAARHAPAPRNNNEEEDDERFARVERTAAAAPAPGASARDVLEASGLDAGFVSALVNYEDRAVSSAQDVFMQVCGESDRIAASVLKNPSEFADVVDLLGPLMLDVPEPEYAYKGACQALFAIGEDLKSAASPPHSAEIFAAHGMDVVCGALKDSKKRASALEVYYCFVAADVASRVDAIMKLKDALGEDDVPSMIWCLSCTVLMENPSSMVGELKDTYLNYVVSGLGEASPSVRSACLSIFNEVRRVVFTRS